MCKRRPVLENRVIIVRGGGGILGHGWADEEEDDEQQQHWQPSSPTPRTTKHHRTSTRTRSRVTLRHTRAWLSRFGNHCVPAWRGCVPRSVSDPNLIIPRRSCHRPIMPARRNTIVSSRHSSSYYDGEINHVFTCYNPLIAFYLIRLDQKAFERQS